MQDQAAKAEGVLLIQLGIDRSRFVVAVGVLVGMLAASFVLPVAPARAAVGDTETAFSLTLGPVATVDGYSATLQIGKGVVQLFVSKTTQGSETGVTSKAKQVHEHSYDVGRSFSVRRDLSLAEVDESQKLDPLGSLKGTFRATRAPTRNSTCDGGTYKFVTRKGKFRGSAVIDSEMDMFGKIDFTGARAKLVKMKYVVGETCEPPDFCTSGMYLTVQTAHMGIKEHGNQTLFDYWFATDASNGFLRHTIAGTTNDQNALIAEEDLSAVHIDLSSIPGILGSPDVDTSSWTDPLSCGTWPGTHTGSSGTLSEPITVQWDPRPATSIGSDEYVDVFRYDN